LQHSLPVSVSPVNRAQNLRPATCNSEPEPRNLKPEPQDLQPATCNL